MTALQAMYEDYYKRWVGRRDAAPVPDRIPVRRDAGPRYDTLWLEDYDAEHGCGPSPDPPPRPDAPVRRAECDGAEKGL